ncbi:hypothetical protein PVAND_006006 [Polypedilum vanderplanki]|uniref:Symplekin n=1 Tax=Polypedilum vanderplanki TaxID=319348 RepID=A0A9J6C2Q0_POLVA|nr:hypothetical protein PVAND_006006 [Polypedilum vanderplanki]
MASIIPGLLIDESETPFSQEDVVRARTSIMENLNQLLTASSPSTKIELVTKIQEQVLKWAPAMRVLEEVIDDVLALSLDQNQDVKKSIINFIEEVCKQRIRMLPKVIKCLTMLLREESAMVIKRVMQACGTIYKATLQWMCTSEDVTEEMNECWDQLCFIKLQILDMIDHENDGIRTNAIKFLEIVVLLQTHSDDDSMKRENDFSLDDVPLTLAHIRRRKLEEEAVNIFDLLLKFHGASHISSVNLIACTGTLCTIAKMRPKLMGQVVEALKLLHSNLPPTLTNSQVASVRKNLKMQFVNLLKQPASYEWRSMIVPILSDLGASQNEINRAIPKMSQSELLKRKQKAQENEDIRKAKVARLELEEKERTAQELAILKEMEDDELILEQERKCELINEKFIADAIKSIDVASQLVINSMINLPDKIPAEFIKNYQPATTVLSIQDQINIIAKTFASQLTELKLGPGAKELLEVKPLKSKTSLKEDKISKEDDDEEYQKDETTRKLRETLARVKHQPKMKQRIKTLKLHEITKPLPKELKHQFLNDAVRKILNCERQAVIGGAGFKRKKIITVFASTFMPSVREIIMEYIMENIVKRFDLAFMWLFEEYSLMQGFTRFSYVKSEHKHDYAYNRLLAEFILKIFNRGTEFRERESLLKRLYLEAPLISDESIDILTRISEHDDLYECGLVLLKDLLIRRPPKEEQLLMTLLKFAVHQKTSIREKAIENVMIVYNMHQILVENIEIFAIKLVKMLEKPTPTSDVLNILSMQNENVEAWTEDMIKSCLNLYLTILPYNEMLLPGLVPVYVESTSDVKRVILRSIEVPIKKLGTDSKEIFKILETCAKGTETLVTRIIYILTETQTPSLEMVEKVKNLYNTKLNDVRILIPIILHIPKKEIIAALPKFLKLNPQLMKDVFLRLLGVKNDALKSNLQPITPTELLVALHAIDTSQAELRLIVKATSLCLAEKEVYTHEVLGVVMQQLVEMNPLPTLLMRTVIQSHTMYPRLSGFITNLLQRLIVKQVWKNKLIWDGFVKCCQRLQCMGVLVQLPTAQLQDALTICPDLKNPLIEYAREMNKHQMGHVTQNILDILGEGQSSTTGAIKSEPMDVDADAAPPGI